MAIAQLVDKVTNAVEKNETTIGIFLDLSKAFDRIDHKILLHKLEHYGFRGKVLEWFKNYLTNRTQYVVLIIVLRIQKISFVVSHRVPYWVHYFLYCMLMISHIHQISLIYFVC